MTGVRLVAGRRPLIVWASVLSEIEGMTFIALGIVLHRADLFLDIQPALLPAAVLVATASAAATLWRLPLRRRQRAVADVEEVVPTDLAARIGAPPAALSPARASSGGARWRRALEDHP